YENRLLNGNRFSNHCNLQTNWSCTISHNASSASAALNPFGIAFKKTTYTWTNALCQNDNDGDGLTNSIALGDPNCVWNKNRTPHRIVNITHLGI
ncbi:uncharacterized protein TRIADDRAFT_32688, partial [Trichoplax adhaerens]